MGPLTPCVQPEDGREEQDAGYERGENHRHAWKANPGCRQVHQERNRPVDGIEHRATVWRAIDAVSSAQLKRRSKTSIVPYPEGCRQYERGRVPYEEKENQRCRCCDVSVQWIFWRWRTLTQWWRRVGQQDGQCSRRRAPWLAVRVVNCRVCSKASRSLPAMLDPTDRCSTGFPRNHGRYFRAHGSMENNTTSAVRPSAQCSRRSPPVSGEGGCNDA